MAVSDDDEYLGLGLDLKAPGTIRVQMHRVHVTGQGDWKAGALPENKIVVHEKSKKAGRHVTGYVELNRLTNTDYNSNLPY